MRKTLQAVKSIFIVALVLLCAFFVLCLTHAPVFGQGESYEVYYGQSSSSRMNVTQNPLLEKLTGKVTGESVRYQGNRYEEIKEQFGAVLLFEEEACGVKNYYLYSPALGAGVELCGYAVNLHVAVSAQQTAAGTPLIFGGF